VTASPPSHREPPHSAEAEEYLLSCCLIDGADVLARCLESRISPESFFDPAHAIVFERLLDLYNRQIQIDLAVLGEELKSSNQLDTVGGYPFLTRVGGCIPTTAQAGYFIEKVRDLSLQRQFLSVVNEANEAWLSGGVSVAALVERIDSFRDSAAFTAITMQTRLDAARLCSDLEPPPLHEVFRLNRIPIATPGNLVGICAQAKAGKTAFVGAMLGATMPNGVTGDFLGIASDNAEGRAVVHLDTEQARRDHWLVIQTALRRAGLKVPPPWLLSFGLSGWSIADRRLALGHILKLARREFGGVHSLFLDGVADFVNDPNDGAECFPFLDSLQGLAVKFECPVITVLHLNPGSAEKSRGHLGSHLERRAETNLLLEKDGETGCTVVYSTKQRRAPILKADGPRFRWDESEQMHVSVETVRAERDQQDRDYLTEIARDSFADTPARRMRYYALIEAVRKTAKCGERTAQARVKKMKTLGVIREVPPRLLELAT
jgi:hypothetical protein